MTSVAVLGTAAQPTPNPRPLPPPGTPAPAPPQATPVAAPMPTPPPCTSYGPPPNDYGLIQTGFTTLGTTLGGPVGGLVGFTLGTFAVAGETCTSTDDGGFSSTVSSDGTTTDPQGATTQDSYDQSTNTITQTIIPN